MSKVFCMSTLIRVDLDSMNSGCKISAYLDTQHFISYIFNFSRDKR